MKNIQIFGITIVVLLFIWFVRMKENYTIKDVRMRKYSVLSKPFPYIKCEDYGYVVPKDDTKAAPIKMWKCHIGLPAHSVRYKIFANDISRYTSLFKPHDFGPVVGEYLWFDNNKEYQLIK